MQQAYTLHVDEPAEREDGTIFRDSEVRQRLDRQGLRERRHRRRGVDALHGRRRADGHHRAAHGHAAHGHPPRDVPRCAASRPTPSTRRYAYFQLDLGGGHARRSALPVEREDALRQDVHRLPARQEARREARARRDVQAGRRGRLADRPRVPRRLRRLAVPLARVRQRPDADRPEASRSSTSAPSRTSSAATRPATSRPRTSGSTTVNWDLVVFDEYHFGAWRDTAKELFEGEDDAVAKKETKLEYAADLERSTRTSSELSEQRGRVPADHDQGVPLPVRHAVQGAGDR